MAVPTGFKIIYVYILYQINSSRSKYNILLPLIQVSNIITFPCLILRCYCMVLYIKNSSRMSRKICNLEIQTLHQTKITKCALFTEYSLSLWWQAPYTALVSCFSSLKTIVGPHLAITGGSPSIITRNWNRTAQCPQLHRISGSANQRPLPSPPLPYGRDG